MDLTTERLRDVVVVRVPPGRLDAAVAIEFKDAFRGIAEATECRVVLDIGQVDFLDSSGLGALVAATKQLGPDRPLALAATRPSVERVLRLTRMDSIFALYPDLDSAVGPGSAAQRETVVTMQVAPRLDAVGPAAATLKDELAGLSLSDEEWHAIDLVLTETLTNVVLHAAPTGPIRLQLTPASRGLFVAIEDDGIEMPGGGVPEGALPVANPAIETPPDHGYGWFLIRAIARDIDYRRDNGLNVLRFRLAVGG